MKSNQAITCFSHHHHHLVHAYYDICPESPDGAHVLASAFEGDVPGPCFPSLFDREGGFIRHLDQDAHGMGHNGQNAMWLDTEHIGLFDEEGWCQVNLNDQVVNRHPGRLRQWSIPRQQGLVQEQANPQQPLSFFQKGVLFDREGHRLWSFGVEELDLGLPLEDLDLRNLKWSPDQSCFSGVVTNELGRRRYPNEQKPDLVKLLVLGDPDLQKLSIVGPFSHHPHWLSSGDGWLAYFRGNEPQLSTSALSSNQALAKVTQDGSEILLESCDGVHAVPSLDDRFVYHDIQDHGQSRGSIVRRDLQDASSVELASFEHHRWEHQDGFHIHPVLSRDGRAIYFNAMDGGSCRLWRMDL